jgi:hypothetical protein
MWVDRFAFTADDIATLEHWSRSVHLKLRSRVARIAEFDKFRRELIELLTDEKYSRVQNGKASWRPGNGAPRDVRVR